MQTPNIVIYSAPNGSIELNAKLKDDTFFSIDFKDIYVGVIEYLSNGKKTWIRKNGIIEER